jgi:biopolymer transport protein ExbD
MKYLHAVLTVIAVCLVLITFAVTGILPMANARETNPRFVAVPVNADGSITVKFVKEETMDVNIDEVNGKSITWGRHCPLK